MNANKSSVVRVKIMMMRCDTSLRCKVQVAGVLFFKGIWSFFSVVVPDFVVGMHSTAAFKNKKRETSN